MGVIRQWTEDAVREEAKRHPNRTQFRKNQAGAFTAAKKFGILDELFPPTESVLKYGFTYTNDDLFKAAQSCSDRREFRQTFPSHYTTAVRRKILHQVLAGIPKPVRTDITVRTDGQIIDAAASYKTLADFARGDKGAYRAAYRRPDVWEFIKKRMVFGGLGLDRDAPGYLYYVKFFHPAYGDIYKIGLSQYGAAERFRKEAVSFAIIKEWPFETLREAEIEEQLLLKEHAAYAYEGEKFLRYHGEREMFTKDVLGLDTTQIAA